MEFVSIFPAICGPQLVPAEKGLHFDEQGQFQFCDEGRGVHAAAERGFATCAGRGGDG